MFVKKGTLIDATIVEAQAKRPPLSEGPKAKSGTDPDARFTRKRGKSHFGYKAHIGMDAGSALIREAVLTPANVNDTEVADGLVSGDEEGVYADKGVRVEGASGAAEVARDQGPDHAPLTQASGAAPALATAAECADIPGASGGGEGVRDVEAVVRV